MVWLWSVRGSANCSRKEGEFVCITWCVLWESSSQSDVSGCREVLFPNHVPDAESASHCFLDHTALYTRCVVNKYLLLQLLLFIIISYIIISYIIIIVIIIILLLIDQVEYHELPHGAFGRGGTVHLLRKADDVVPIRICTYTEQRTEQRHEHEHDSYLISDSSIGTVYI